MSAITSHDGIMPPPTSAGNFGGNFSPAGTARRRTVRHLTSTRVETVVNL
jgi:hypothetical protein